MTLRRSGATVIRLRISNDASRALEAALVAARASESKAQGRNLSDEDTADLITALLIQHTQENQDR